MQQQGNLVSSPENDQNEQINELNRELDAAARASSKMEKEYNARLNKQAIELKAKVVLLEARTLELEQARKNARECQATIDNLGAEMKEARAVIGGLSQALHIPDMLQGATQDDLSLIPEAQRIAHLVHSEVMVSGDDFRAHMAARKKAEKEYQSTDQPSSNATDAEIAVWFRHKVSCKQSRGWFSGQAAHITTESPSCLSISPKSYSSDTVQQEKKNTKTDLPGQSRAVALKQLGLLHATSSSDAIDSAATAKINGTDTAPTEICVRFPDINLVSELGPKTIQACQDGDLKSLARYLGEDPQGLLLEYRDTGNGLTPLISAAASDQTEVCRLLLKSGASLESKGAACGRVSLSSITAHHQLSIDLVFYVDAPCIGHYSLISLPLFVCLPLM